MDHVTLTTNHALREYERRLRDSAKARQANDAYRRMKIRSSLRRAIVETLRLDGDVQELATEFTGLIRSAERRFDRRPCC